MSQTRVQLIEDGHVVNADLASNAVTTAKVADDAITLAKLSATGTPSSSTFLRGDNSFQSVPAGAGKARNVLINGDFQIAQRATSSTDNNYGSVDRWTCQQGGLDEACTQAQVDVASGTSPYGEGFRKAWKITNGNQTSGAGAADYIEIYQYVEGHTMANCGWDYKNSNSKMTLSFWIKSSVAQKFAGFLYTTNTNGTSVHYMYDYSIDNGGSNLTADTWTKITHTFPGNSNLNITDGTGYGLGFGIYPFQGTNYTTSRSPSQAWQTWDTSNKVPDMTSTWYTTNDATLEITGVQLEVGDEATDFEHRSRQEEIALCHRYFYIYGFSEHNSDGDIEINFIPADMRVLPTVTRLGNVMFGGESSTAVTAIYNNAGYSVPGQPGSNLILRCINSSDANCGGCYSFNAEL